MAAITPAFLNFPVWCFRKIQMLTARYPNLAGDRDVEGAWIASQMPPGAGAALDFGCGGSNFGLIAAERGYHVTAVDLQSPPRHFCHSRLEFKQGDIFKLPLTGKSFDLVINCSVIEHVGLEGRYGVSNAQPDGDIEAMSRLADLMKSGATMLLTIPVGQDAVFAPICRIYGQERLPKLLKSFIPVKETYWIKNEKNQWIESDKQTALSFEARAGSWIPLRNVYALGCFVLRKP